MFKLVIKYFLIVGVAFTLLSSTLWVADVEDNNAFSTEFLKRINEVRQQGCKCGTTYMPPVPPLVWNNQLERAAKAHAQDMSKRSYFNHTSKDGRSIQNRIMAAGYTYDGYKSFAIGENIAQGQESISEVSNGWFKSPRHCMNLMNRDFTEVGIAEVNRYWVQDFGGREPFTEREKELIKSGRLKIRKVN
ncbi:CAP domain-containing protein [Mucilaginibacter terrae]|uniref:Uncharacterized protein YkwD n=1 Tax=Mucilaginibacter terrae TaxID=1955052 RepID=A0ABU3GYQ7_9SPHI|nr:CAP domain-containing protein [Mucilaginibacter terrae]MDT3404907.1 uncharacterized protein YkwD [Mucilaginibacter terrae]